MTQGPVRININRLNILLAEMHSVLPEVYQVAFVARNAMNSKANIVLTDMGYREITEALKDAGMNQGVKDLDL
jgi:hypothetical protein